MKIIITGSLGHVSKPVTLALVKQGHQVTVISSSPEREQEIISIGAKPAIGSLKDVEFLSATFSGTDLVYAMVPPDYHQPDQLGYYQLLGRNYITAIEKAGVPRAVLLSSFGANLDAGTGNILGSHHMEEMFKKLESTKTVFIRPTSFYYNLLSFIPVIKATGKIIGNYGGDDKILMVSPEDIAEVVVEEIIKPSGKQVRYISSDEKTCNEVATVLGQAIGIPDLTWVTIPDDVMRSNLEAAGTPPQLAASLTETFSALHNGLLASDYYSNPPGSMGRVKIADYAREFAKIYKTT